MRRLKLSESRCLVTGAASGIGHALALEFASRRSDLVLVSRPEEGEKLSKMKRQISAEHDVDVRICAVDLTSKDAIEQIEAATDGLVVDVLVNNAGVLSYGEFHEIGIDQQIQMVRVNIESLMRMTHHFAGPMAERGEGWILNISSVSAFQPTAYHAVYAATKAFVQSFSEAIHAELAGKGVYVGTLNPPYTKTPMIDEIPTLPWNRYVPTMSAEDVAIAGVETLLRERLYYIPDWQSRFANGFAPRLFPRRFAAWLSARMLRPR